MQMATLGAAFEPPSDISIGPEFPTEYTGFASLNAIPSSDKSIMQLVVNENGHAAIHTNTPHSQEINQYLWIPSSPVAEERFEPSYTVYNDYNASSGNSLQRTVLGSSPCPENYLDTNPYYTTTNTAATADAYQENIRGYNQFLWNRPDFGINPRDTLLVPDDELVNNKRKHIGSDDTIDGAVEQSPEPKRRRDNNTTNSAGLRESRFSRLNNMLAENTNISAIIPETICCNQKFTMALEFAMHLDTYHADDTSRLSCGDSKCVWSVLCHENQTDFKKHLHINHSYPRNKCFNCGRIYSRSDALYRHIKNVHNKASDPR